MGMAFAILQRPQPPCPQPPLFAFGTPASLYSKTYTNNSTFIQTSDILTPQRSCILFNVSFFDPPSGGLFSALLLYIGVFPSTPRVGVPSLFCGYIFFDRVGLLAIRNAG